VTARVSLQKLTTATKSGNYDSVCPICYERWLSSSDTKIFSGLEVKVAKCKKCESKRTKTMPYVEF